VDPIHPIVPRPPAIPRVAPAPPVARVGRDGGRREAGDQSKRRKRPAPRDDVPSTPVGDAEPGTHIDLTA
jgi:hypothetical protein